MALAIEGENIGALAVMVEEGESITGLPVTEPGVNVLPDGVIGVWF